MTPPPPSAASVGQGSHILILGQVSKPSSKRNEKISFATLSGDLKGGAHGRIIVDPFCFNGSMHKAGEKKGYSIRCE